MDAAGSLTSEHWAAALTDGLRVVDLSGDDAAALLDAELSRDYDAALCVDRLTAELVPALRRHAETGLRLLLSLSDVEIEPALELFQGVGDGSLLFAAAGYVYVVNVPEAVLSEALSAPHARLHAAPLDTGRLRALELANRELWARNNELGRQLAELRDQLGDDLPPLSAARIGAVPAGSALAQLARDEEAERARAAEAQRQLRLRIEQLEWELGERVRALDAEIQRVGGERDAAARDRDLASRELDTLKGRRAVRVALRLADLRRGRFRG